MRFGGSSPTYLCSVAVPSAVAGNLLSEQCAEILSAAEREKMGRFHHEHDAVVYGVAHILCRKMLSICIDRSRSPQAWRFVIGPFGKPSLAESPEVEFSLSHTQGMAVCAVTSEGPLGVDVEYLGRSGDYLDIAARHFTAREYQYVTAVAAEQRHRAFFEVWTLKEAVIKATGMGLSQPLKSFCVAPDSKALSVSFGGADFSHWQLAQFCEAETHVGSLALRSTSQLRLRRHSLNAEQLFELAFDEDFPSQFESR